MTSRRKVEANRANAQNSTGPSTAQGKARAAHNTRRHGLNRSVFADPVLSQQVEMMAAEIAGETADEEIYELARRVAEAQTEVLRVRYARHQIISDLLNNPHYHILISARKKASIIPPSLTACRGRRFRRRREEAFDGLSAAARFRKACNNSDVRGEVTHNGSVRATRPVAPQIRYSRA